MPNHVDHDMWVVGDNDTIQQFQQFAAEDDMLLSANKFIPYPEQFKKLDEEAKEHCAAGDWSFKDGFNSGGYEWCCDNWGTKWGIYDAVLKDTKHNKKGTRTTLLYNFNSAWSPALKIILAMSEKFPTLIFKARYYECGAQFKGFFVATNGKEVEHTFGNYRGHRGG